VIRKSVLPKSGSGRIWNTG